MTEGSSLVGVRPAGRWWAFVQSERVAAAVALGGVFAVTALAYWWTRAPLYNPYGTIDPWLYTALFVNFDELYEGFSTTYYAARLPWIVPGRLAYTTFSVDVAYWLLHGLAFAGGVAGLFFLIRRYLGLAAAVVGAATLALSPMYWNAQYWDYIDGVALTYVLAGLCLGLPLAKGRARAASLFGAGVLFAAAVTTNPFALLAVLTYPIKYAFLQPAAGLRRRGLLALTDLVALVAGALTLVIALGFYARSHGGPFRYYEPQLDFIRSGAGGTYKVAGYEWLRNEPKLLVPLFLLVVAAPLLVFGRRLPPFRFAAGSVGGLMFLTATIYGWEFMAGGAALEYSWYFSYFAGAIALTVASIAALAAALVQFRWSASVGVAAVAIVAAVVALGLIYRSERVEWTGSAGGRISLWVLICAAFAVLVAFVTRRTRRGALAWIVATGAVAFASHFAINSSSQTFLYGASAPINRDLYHAALDNVAFVERSREEGDPLPAFWYRGTNTSLTSIQSMYFYSYTAIGWELPKVTGDTRQRLNLFRPQKIVMLCETRKCQGAVATLRRAGYRYAEERAEHISRGRVRLWAVLLQSHPAKTTPDPEDVRRRTMLRNGDLLRAPPASEIYAYWAGRKHWIVSMDVLLSVFGPNALASVREVPAKTVQRLPSGPRLTSAQVWSKVRARGSKER